MARFIEYRCRTIAEFEYMYEYCKKTYDLIPCSVIDTFYKNFKYPAILRIVNNECKVLYDMEMYFIVETKTIMRQEKLKRINE